MQQYPYGSVEYYMEHFSDIIADVGDDGSPKAGEKILAAFKAAIESWLESHQNSAAKYEELLANFISNTNA